MTYIYIIYIYILDKYSIKPANFYFACGLEQHLSFPLGFISSPFNNKTAYSVVILVMFHVDLALKRVIALKSKELLSIRKDFIDSIHFNFSFSSPL